MQQRRGGGLLRQRLGCREGGLAGRGQCRRAHRRGGFGVGRQDFPWSAIARCGGDSVMVRRTAGRLLDSNRKNCTTRGNRAYGYEIGKAVVPSGMFPVPQSRWISNDNKLRLGRLVAERSGATPTRRTADGQQRQAGYGWSGT
jgi:hypothetical protein